MPDSKAQQDKRFEALQKVLEEDPSSLAFVSLAEEHIRRKNYAEAVNVAQRGLLSHPDSVAGRLTLAVAEAEQNHIREALHQIKRALIIDQENPKSLALMGRILLKKGLAKRAAQFLSHAVKLAPEEPEYRKDLLRARDLAQQKPQKKLKPKPEPKTEEAPPIAPTPWSDDPTASDKDVVDEAAVTQFAAKLFGPPSSSGRLHVPNAPEKAAEKAPLPRAPSLLMDRKDRPPAQMGGSAAPEATKLPSKTPAASGAAAPINLTDKKKDKAETPLKGSAEQSQTSPRPPKAIGPSRTLFIEDALWSLVGGKKPSTSDAPLSSDAPSQGADGAAAGQSMVVRTSESLGHWTRRAFLLVLTASGLWGGYALGVSRTGKGPEIAIEEIRGIAASMERGGLAALDSTEEAIQVLLETNPALAPLLNGVAAEVHARRYANFGGGDKEKAAARSKIRGLKETRPSVEYLAAMVAVSTSADDRKALDASLKESLKDQSESPKSWVLRAQLARQDGRDKDELASLYEAYTINRHHRQTLLELARWYGRHEAYSTAIEFYEKIGTLFPEDIEAALERYVIGQKMEKDPNESEAVSKLAGLARDELPRVAKDEAGRVALLFSVANFSKGNGVEGKRQLHAAEPAFQENVIFRKTIAGIYTALGNWSKAEQNFKKAIALDPHNIDLKVGLARARFGALSKLTGGASGRGKMKKSERGIAVLPFGRIQMQIKSFPLVTVIPRLDPFTDVNFKKEMSRLSPDQIEGQLANMLTLTKAQVKYREGKYKDALNLLNKTPSGSTSFSLLTTRCYLGLEKYDAAIQTARSVLKTKPSNLEARILLGRALLADGQSAKALTALKPLISSDILVPSGLHLLARAKMTRGDYKGAGKVLEALQNIQPNDSEINRDLATSYHYSGRPDDALKTYTRIFKDRKLRPKTTDISSGVPLYYFGRIELDRSKSAGIALLKGSLQKKDAPPAAHFFLGQTLVAKRSTRRQGRNHLKTFIRTGSENHLRREARKILRRR